MKTMRLFAAAAGCLMTACGSMNYLPESMTYQPPAGSATARLAVRNAVGEGEVSMTVHQQVECRDAGKYVPNTTLKPGAESSMDIQAGQPVSFAVQSLRPVRGNANVVVPGLIALNVCHVAGTFTPAPNAHYVATFTDKDGVCGVSVHHPGAAQPVEGFVEKRWFPRSMSDGWRCAVK